MRTESPHQQGHIVDGRWRIVSEFEDAGGMGRVYVVEDLETSSRCALKQCLMVHDKLLRRFRAEVETMAGISHPNVMEVLAHNLQCELPYFVMPLGTGTLEDEAEDLKHQEGPLLTAFLQVLDGVAAIHKLDLVHRDIKPANFIRMPDGSVVVADLGLVKLPNSKITEPGDYIGTLHYVAPEITKIGAKALTRKADVYSLGVTLYVLLTGNDPAVVNLATIPHPVLRSIVRQCILDDPDSRYPDAGRVAIAVREYQRGVIHPSADGAALCRLIIEGLGLDLRNGTYSLPELRLALSYIADCASPQDTRSLFLSMPVPLLEVAAMNHPLVLLPSLRAFAESMGDRALEGLRPTFAEKVLRIAAVLMRSPRRGVRVNAVAAAGAASELFSSPRLDYKYSALLQDLGVRERSLVRNRIAELR